MRWSKEKIEQVFQQFHQLKVGIIGDVMLDTYWWGNVDRISPEAPVPIVALQKREYRIGGAGNVGLNALSLGASVAIFSVVGKDEDGKQLLELFQAQGINTQYCVASKDRITTNKVRIISRNQQMMRLDAETTADITPSEEALLLKQVEIYLEKEQPDVLILEDYNKGVLTPSLIESVVALAKSRNIPIAVDPKKKNFFAYKGVTIFKPNLKEVKEGLNISLSHVDTSHLQAVHEALKAQLSHDVSFITLSELGVFYAHGNEVGIIPSHLRNIADVSGAGDTVIATASLVYAATRDVSLMAAIANIAGGLVCEIVGTAAINKEKLFIESIRLLA